MTELRESTSRQGLHESGNQRGRTPAALLLAFLLHSSLGNNSKSIQLRGCLYFVFVFERSEGWGKTWLALGYSGKVTHHLIKYQSWEKV